MEEEATEKNGGLIIVVVRLADDLSPMIYPDFAPGIENC